MFNSIKSSELYKALVVEKQLGQSLALLKQYLDAHHLPNRGDAIAAIDANYGRMKAFMLKGYADEKQAEIYGQMLTQVYWAACNAFREVEQSQTPYYKVVYSHMQLHDFSDETVVATLRRYVEDISLLSLEQGNTDEKARHISARHHSYINALFEWVTLSEQWTDSKRVFYTQLLLDPTIDVTDRLLLISAVTLGCLNVFDANKEQTLMTVYEQSVDADCRKRAFVGMIIATDMAVELYPQLAERLHTLVGRNKNAFYELLRLMVLAANADRDMQKIKQDILPTLLDNQALIKEMFADDMEDRSVEEVLRQEETEQAMDELEEHLSQMQDMIREGADIYFGGMAQTKRHPFFMAYDNTCNWLLPFDADHSELNRNKTPERQALLKALARTDAFCDSDKYSLALNLDALISQLPPNMLDALSDASAFGPQVNYRSDITDYMQPGYIKDLYRFYRFGQFQSAFCNPFDVAQPSSALDGVCRFFVKDTDEGLKECLKFLFKHQYTEYLEMMFRNLPHGVDTGTALLHARHLLLKGEYLQAQLLLENLYEDNPMHWGVTVALARCYYLSRQYGRSATLYSELYQQRPFSQRVAQALASALLADGRAKEASDLLFKLYYTQPEEMNIQRDLAHALLLQGKADAARPIAEKLMAVAEPTDTDRLLMCYVLAAAHDMEAATALIKECEGSVMASIQKDRPLLMANGLTETEIHILADWKNE